MTNDTLTVTMVAVTAIICVTRVIRNDCLCRFGCFVHVLIEVVVFSGDRKHDCAFERF